MFRDRLLEMIKLTEAHWYKKLFKLKCYNTLITINKTVFDLFNKKKVRGIVEYQGPFCALSFIMFIKHNGKFLPSAFILT